MALVLEKFSAFVTGLPSQPAAWSGMAVPVLIGGTSVAFNPMAAPPITANQGLWSLGAGPWDGATSGKFVGSASGTHLAINSAGSFTGSFIDCQLAGVSGVSGTDNEHPFFRVGQYAGLGGTTTYGHWSYVNLPTVLSTVAYGAYTYVNTSGSSAFDIIAYYGGLRGTYTGPNNTVGVAGANVVPGTSTAVIGGIGGGVGNIGVRGTANPTGGTAGSSIGVAGRAFASTTVNVGTLGSAVLSATGANVGVLGAGRNDTGFQIGGYFVLKGNTSGTDDPLFNVSSALLCDNGAQSANIFLARDNGTAVFTIANNGLVSIANGVVTGASTSSNFLSVAGTLPSVLSAVTLGVTMYITPAGSSAQDIVAVDTGLNAGYTGSNPTVGLSGFNVTAGTSNVIIGGIGGCTGNVGVRGTTNISTTGVNFGGSFRAYTSSFLNVGALGSAHVDTTGANVGIIGAAKNSTGIRVGGWFALRGNQSGTDDPVIDVSAGLVASNGAQAADIFIARDGTTTVFKIADGGNGAGSSGTTTFSGSTSGSSLTSNFLNVTGTLPTTLTANCRGVFFDITPAGSSSFEISAFRVMLESGYTGTSSSYAGRFTNSTAGTNSSGYNNGNIGLLGEATATTVGNNLGAYYAAQGGNLNIGSYNQSTTDKASAINIGVISLASNLAATPTVVGGYFALRATVGTITNAGLIVDNGAAAYPILIGQDNGTTVFTITDGGLVKVAPVSGAMSGGSTTSNFLNLTGTLPTTMTAATYGVNFQLTSAGSSSQAVSGMNLELLAGYTGSSNTNGLKVTNRAAGTGTDWYSLTVNQGVYGSTVTANSGANVGVVGDAFLGSTMNIGVLGRAVGGSGVTANIGVVGIAVNASTRNIAGFFSYHNATPTISGQAVLICDDAGLPVDIFQARANGTPIVRILGVPTGSSTTSNFLNITGTLPTTLTATTKAVYFGITTAGSSAQQIQGFNVELLPGYTGGTSTLVARFSNTVAGTGTGALTVGNLGLLAESQATTTGNNIGGFFEASNGNNSLAVFGRATTDKASAANVGVIGIANNGAATPTAVGGYFGLQTAPGTFATAALMCDNGAVAADIFVARDNGTAVFTIADGGNITLTGTLITLSTNATTLSATGTGANGLKLKNLKNSANTAVSGTVKTVEIDIGGTPYFFLVSPTSSP